MVSWYMINKFEGDLDFSAHDRGFIVSICDGPTLQVPPEIL